MNYIFIECKVRACPAIIATWGIYAGGQIRIIMKNTPSYVVYSCEENIAYLFQYKTLINSGYG